LAADPSDTAFARLSDQTLSDLSRQQRRRIKRLADQVDKVLETDRRFFERRPDRSYRVRRAFSAEVEVEALVNGLASPPPLPGGFARFVAVGQFAPGVRERLFLTAPAGAEPALRNACREVRGVSDAPEQPRSGIPGLTPYQIREQLLRNGWAALPILEHDASDKNAGKRPVNAGWEEFAEYGADLLDRTHLDDWDSRFGPGARYHAPGTGIAMGNAGAAVIAAADHVTGPNDRDGAAHAIDALLG
jgi:hypothetical protein